LTVSSSDAEKKGCMDPCPDYLKRLKDWETQCAQFWDRPCPTGAITGPRVPLAQPCVCYYDAASVTGIGTMTGNCDSMCPPNDWHCNTMTGKPMCQPMPQAPMPQAPGAWAQVWVRFRDRFPTGAPGAQGEPGPPGAPGICTCYANPDSLYSIQTMIGTMTGDCDMMCPPGDHNCVEDSRKSLPTGSVNAKIMCVPPPPTTEDMVVYPVRKCCQTWQEWCRASQCQCCNWENDNHPGSTNPGEDANAATDGPRMCHTSRPYTGLPQSCDSDNP